MADKLTPGGWRILDVEVECRSCAASEHCETTRPWSQQGDRHCSRCDGCTPRPTETRPPPALLLCRRHHLPFLLEECLAITPLASTGWLDLRTGRRRAACLAYVPLRRFFAWLARCVFLLASLAVQGILSLRWEASAGHGKKRPQVEATQ